MSIPLDVVDMSTVQLGNSGRVDWTGQVEPGAPYGVRSGRAHLRILNESGAGLTIMMGGSLSGFHLAAGGWQDVQISGESFFTWLCQYIQQGPTPNVLLVTLYLPGEPVPPPPILGNSPVGISGTVSTGGSGGTGTNFLKNDGAIPATSLIEATPNDQGNSAWAYNNDASGFLQVLSANVLRKVLNIVRGNATTGKAVVTLGDSGDTSITTFYGQVGAGSGVPVATLGAGALPAGVTVPPARLSAGAIPAGVTIPGGQVSSAVANATNATSATNATNATNATTADGATALNADASPASQMTGHIAATNFGLLVMPQAAGVAMAFGARVWDGAAFHDVVLANSNGTLAGPNVSYFSGSGAGTFSHGLGVTPSWVGITDSTLNSTMTVGVDTLGSTTCHVNTGAGHTWRGVAMS